MTNLEGREKRGTEIYNVYVYFFKNHMKSKILS